YCKDLLRDVPALKSQAQVYQSIVEAATLAMLQRKESIYGQVYSRFSRPIDASDCYSSLSQGKKGRPTIYYAKYQSIFTVFTRTSWFENTGVTPQQFRVYEEFGKNIPNLDVIPFAGLPAHAPPMTQNVGLTQPQQQQAQMPTQILTSEQIRAQQQQQQLQKSRLNQPSQSAQPPGVNVPNPQGGIAAVQSDLEQNQRVLVHLMDILVSQIKENATKNNLAELGDQNQIKTIIFQILTFIAKSAQKDQLALKVSQAVVNSLFATSESPLCREVLSLLLEKLCSLSLVARKTLSGG
ncbi:hypothetical protein FOB22_004718, partial [Saccharomyces cerevisiae]